MDTNELYTDSIFSVCGNFDGEIADLKRLVIPDGTKVIGDMAFGNYYFLQSVEIPQSVEEIGWYAFYNCNFLSEIIFPEVALHIGNGAFEKTAWYAGKPDGIVNAGKNVYKYKGLCGETPVVLPNDALTVADGAFQKQYGLTSVTLSPNLKYIGGWAFDRCCNLEDIVLPDELQEIGSSAFWGCSSFKKIIIPNNVQKIGDNAFYDCNNLSEITFAEGSEWKITRNYREWKEKRGGESVVTTNPRLNATLLKTAYADYYWYKTN